MTATASDIEDIEHKGGVIECHSESPFAEYNAALQHRQDMPEVIAIPLAVVLLIGAIAFTLIFFRGDDE